MPTIIQSQIAKGSQPVASAFEAGTVVATRVTHTLTAAPTANDVLELAVLPARHRIVDIRLDTTGTITINKTGIMSGDVGSKDGARTVGDALITSGAANADARALAPTEADRSIGCLLTSATPGAVVSATILYAQGI